MKQETFVGIINALKQQEERNDTFAEAVKQAFIGAGECSDFRDSPSYYPPTSVMQDAILEALAKEFISKHQTKEQALDLINYWFYDLAIANYQFMEPVEGDPTTKKPVPAYIEVNGTKVPLVTAEDLYNELMTTKTSGYDTKPADLCNAISDPVPSEPEGIIGKTEKVVLEIIDGYSTHEITPYEPISDTDLDSLDKVEIMIELENRFSITLDDEDCVSLENCLTPADVATWLVYYKNLVVPE